MTIAKLTVQPKFFKMIGERIFLVSVGNGEQKEIFGHNLTERKKLYTEEGKVYYSGNFLVPDDLEVIEL